MNEMYLFIEFTNFDIETWKPKNLIQLITVLGIPEACELEQAKSRNLWTTINFIEKFKDVKPNFLPFFFGELITYQEFEPFLNELKEISKKHPKNIVDNPIYIPGDFFFKIPIPKGTPKRNMEDWLKWCYAIKLLIQYSNNSNPFPMQFLSLRSLFLPSVHTSHSKLFITQIILTFFHNFFPSQSNPQTCKFPNYRPPYPDIEYRETLWSLPKKKHEIILRRQVWLHVLTYISNKPEINFDSIITGINIIIGEYFKTKNYKLFEIIADNLAVFFNHFPDLVNKKLYT